MTSNDKQAISIPGHRRFRALAALALAIGLVAVACGSSSTSTTALGGNPGSTTAPGTGGTSLTTGLSSNLDKLDSYKFTEQIAGSSTGTVASPGDSDSFLISGTVINKGTKAIEVNDLGVLFIDIGNQEWTSFDGTNWTGPTATDTTMTDLLPGNDYGTWFDTNAGNFTVVGNETKNGIPCIHYKGNSSLGALAGAAGVSANFQSDLWVAVSGNYPVSGVYGYTASAGGQGGSFGFSFDITNVNDPANAVTAPANAVAIPT